MELDPSALSATPTASSVIHSVDVTPGSPDLYDDDTDEDEDEVDVPEPDQVDDVNVNPSPPPTTSPSEEAPASPIIVEELDLPTPAVDSDPVPPPPSLPAAPISTDLPGQEEEEEAESTAPPALAPSAAGPSTSATPTHLQTGPSSNPSRPKRRAESTSGDEEALVGHPEKKKPCTTAPTFSNDDDDDEGSVCNICMDEWTNSGEHRISSLKCGHFFGLACIEKWLRGSHMCPNCNERATRRDLRQHYVARLKAIDTSERDRAIKDLEKVQQQKRQLELEHATLKVNLKLQNEEIEKLKSFLRNQQQLPLDLFSSVPSTSSSSSANSKPNRLTYLKRLELIKNGERERDKYCRVMSYNDQHTMLVVSQPSFTSLAPGYGIRRINLLDQKLGSFISLHREPIRDLAFNPVQRDQLLSASQDKCVKLTNVSSCSEIHKYQLDSEVWSCCWNLDNDGQFFAATKRSQIFLFDTRDPSSEPKRQLEFPVTERRPIIGLQYVPHCPRAEAFPCGGLLVQTLGSLWFFEHLPHNDTYKAHKLPVTGLFWSLRFDPDTRLVLASTKPMPHSRHLVCELTRVNTSSDSARPDYQCSANVILNQTCGGSYSERSFLRSALCANPVQREQVLLAYGRGSGPNDHMVVLQELATERTVQQISVQRPVLDILPMAVNGEHFVAVLGENDVILYKWTAHQAG